MEDKKVIIIGRVLDNLYISFWSGKSSGYEENCGAYLLVSGGQLYVA
jgi:hypothetical protein